MRNSTPAEFNDSINWRKSLASGIVLSVSAADQFKQDMQTLRRRQASIVFEGRSISRRKVPEFLDNRLHASSVTEPRAAPLHTFYIAL